MRYFLICNNVDTLTGLRLAGVTGVYANTKSEVENAVEDAMKDKTIGILLINERLAALCPELIFDLKLKAKTPLVVEIPDRHHTGRSPDSITRYIREAIGIQV